ncbi:putative F-box/FBD/LRR-repeat protein [Arabidopsis thaliana]|uniref:FBD domain-containing protein n=2 Tax=Arabidopsis TaxID=3701 RepID=A0A178VYS4_ARATH|nr:FBD domain [Arabidopsis thaliana x Arabidopsis arenosa]KAG7635922.1 FBD domain [Arabidopsis thaliana x Arabidopsis arenosa]OAP11449.1 hypothetical protein AXX17_AT2G04440 [Arabidopsis thaliana]CAA0358302.1 unnamed protein product [Arabidopsis thaliana]
MPLSLYVCDSLVSLRLYRLSLVDAEFVSLPCLKILRLKDIVFHNETTFERLVSSCPVLEELKIDVVWNDGNVYKVHSRSLKRFCFRRSSSLRFDESVPGVVVDAPLLCCLIIDDSVSESFVVTDLESNAKFDISLCFRLWRFDEAKRSIINMFLAWISRVRDMKICAHTFKLIHRYSESSPLPRFGYMSSLYVTLNASELEWFPIFLRSSPNLKSLILERSGSSHQLSRKAMERVSMSSVPECLLTSLEFVEFKAPICGLGPEMMLVWYFLKNSPTLKKLTLPLKSHSTKDDFFKKLLEIPRCSTECEIVIL